MNKNLDAQIESIKTLSEEDRMTVASALIADVMIDRESIDINSKAEFGDPESNFTVLIEIDATLQIKENEI